MDVSCLSVELVETIQSLAHKGKPVGDIVADLTASTLPGLLEYGCLRYQQPSFPPLPDTIRNSQIGFAVLEVRSAIGLRSEGPDKQYVGNLSALPVEFHQIPLNSNLHEDVEWEGFCHRFELAAKQVGFTQNAAINLHSAMFEMAENVRLHAGSPESLVGYKVDEGQAMFSVADVGIGVLKSLQSAPEFSNLTEDVDAIQLALTNGVTSKRYENGGFGFNSVFKALAEQWGQLRFRSGNGCITMDGTDLKVDKSRRHFPLPVPGFQVSVCCRTDANTTLCLRF